MIPPDQLDLFGSAAPPPPPDALDAPSPCGLPPGDPNPPGLAIGACAWNHESYPGRFYPAGLAQRRWLAYYARFCNAVEVDASFYRVPAESTARRWVDETPGGFTFALKAPRTLTHDAYLALEDRVARADWEALLALAPVMGERLGAIVLQLGPGATVFLLEALQRVVASAPPGLPFVVEFRHPSWNTPEVAAFLREAGVVRAWSDQYQDPRRGVQEDSPHLFDKTGPFRYVRLLGDVSTKYERGGTRRFTYGQRLFDREADKRAWVDRLRPELGDGTPVQVYINNHYEGFSILTAQDLRRALR